MCPVRGRGGRGVRTDLGAGLNLILAHEALLDARRAEGAGGHVAAGAEERVTLHVRADHALLQGFLVGRHHQRLGQHGRIAVPLLVALGKCLAQIWVGAKVER